MFRSSRVRQSARGEECTINGPNCNYDPSTTVFAHLNEHWAGKGMGLKADDVGIYACSCCHADLDQMKLEDKYYYIARGIYRTEKRMLETGVKVVA